MLLFAMLSSRKLSWSLIQVRKSSLRFRNCSCWRSDSSKRWRDFYFSFCKCSLSVSISARHLASCSCHRACSSFTCFRIASFSCRKFSICCIICSMVRGSHPLFLRVVTSMLFYVGRDAGFTYPTVGANVPISN